MITTMRERSFDPHAGAIRRARAFAVEAASGDGATSFAEKVALITSELASNAVLHARTEFTVRVDSTDRTVRIAVFDHGAEMPVDRGFDESAVTGRGLSIVGALAERWGVEPVVDGAGKWVWAELQLVGERQPS
jgi:anti-sigma regulatory factor (Ser/Thr protein kinase)